MSINSFVEMMLCALGAHFKQKKRTKCTFVFPFLRKGLKGFRNKGLRAADGERQRR